MKNIQVFSGEMKERYRIVVEEGNRGYMWLGLFT